LLAKLPLLVLAVTMMMAGVALAIVAFGAQNSSFEDDLDHWTASTFHDGPGGNRNIIYGLGGKKGSVVPCDSTRYGICVVGTDSFPVIDKGGERTVTVDPVDGDSMVRFAGPYNADWQDQNPDTFQIEQTFTVDPAAPTLEVNYNYFSFDYAGFDELELAIKVTPDEGGDPIVQRIQGGFGTGTALKTTGWRPVPVDLSGFENQEVTAKISLRGTSDELYGTWAYVDAGVLPQPAASGEQTEATATFPLNKQVDASTGLAYYQAANSQVGACDPITIDVPINPGAGVVSNVSLFLDSPGGDQTVGATNSSGDVWTATIPCFRSGDLYVRYTLTEGGVSQEFLVQLGGLVLIDPQGVVFDQAEFDAAKAGGASDQIARDAASIEGATVRLQRKVNGAFQNVLSGDPGISPNVNPQITPENGLYQWDVSAGEYRVIVSKAGYLTETSAAVTIPPPVLDLHIGLDKPATDPGPPNPGPPNPGPPDKGPPNPGPTDPGPTGDPECDAANDASEKAGAALKKAKAQLKKAAKADDKAKVKKAKKKVKKAKKKVKKAEAARAQACAV